MNHDVIFTTSCPEKIDCTTEVQAKQKDNVVESYAVTVKRGQAK